MARMRAHLGPTLRRLRKEADLGPLDIVTRLGKTEAAVHRFERGEVWPRDLDETVEGYAELLGVEPWELWRAAAESMKNG